MDKVVLPLFLFPSLAWWQTYARSEEVVLEQHENWVKQSARTRFEIGGPNGRQTLSIPTIRSTRTVLNEVEISEEGNWRTLHWRSIQTAYNRSPFFEYYKDDVRAILDTKHPRLVDLSREALEWSVDRLGLESKHSLSKSYVNSEGVDFRSETLLYNEKSYHQVFSEKLGFEPNLSVLDALFNLGPQGYGSHPLSFVFFVDTH